MSYETAPFGDGVTNNIGNVSTFYGRQDVGGEAGKVDGSNGENTFIFDFDGDSPLYDTFEVPLGAKVFDVDQYDVTGTAVVSVGAQTVTAARVDDDATWVSVTTAADITCTGVTAGRVVVKYRYYA